MATAADEALDNSSASVDVVVEQNHENLVSEMPNHGGIESEPIFSEEEVKDTLEISASTGKFWQDWEKLKSILSYYLKQVLSEYPEAKMTSEQQISLLGETFQELVKRFDDALHSFDEGPPFTLQRLCEILLSARSIYPKLSKLSLALEKNLLVTSTLEISSDPRPLATEQKSNGSYEASVDAQPQTNSMENGEPSIGDRDEVMADVQEDEAGEDTIHDGKDTIHEPEASKDTTHESEASKDTTHEAEAGVDSTHKAEAGEDTTHEAEAGEATKQEAEAGEATKQEAEAGEATKQEAGAGEDTKQEAGAGEYTKQEAEAGEDTAMDMETVADEVRASEGNPTPTEDL